MIETILQLKFHLTRPLILDILDLRGRIMGNKIGTNELAVGTIGGILLAVLPMISDAYVVISLIYFIAMVVGMFYVLRHPNEQTIVTYMEQPETKLPVETPEYKQAVEAEERRIEYPDGSAVQARRVRYWQ